MSCSVRVCVMISVCKGGLQGVNSQPAPRQGLLQIIPHMQPAAVNAPAQEIVLGTSLNLKGRELPLTVLHRHVDRNLSVDVIAGRRQRRARHLRRRYKKGISNTGEAGYWQGRLLKDGSQAQSACCRPTYAAAEKGTHLPRLFLAGPHPHKAVLLNAGQRRDRDAAAVDCGGHDRAVAAAVEAPAVVGALNLTGEGGRGRTRVSWGAKGSRLQESAAGCELLLPGCWLQLETVTYARAASGSPIQA